MRSRKPFVTLAFIAMVLFVSAAAHAQVVRGSGLLEAGPVAGGPMNLFPKFFMDKTGVALEGCLTGPPLCLSSLADLQNMAIGEAFYWSASANLPIPGATRRLVEFALEMAFLNPQPTRANAMVFNRLRVRLNNLPAAGTYVMVHPFGQHSFTAAPDPGGLGFEINDTIDLPGSAGPASFRGVLRAPNLGPFLKQVPAPAGRLGRPDVFRRVTGGPNGNTITVTGPAGFSASTSLFAIEGKLATNGGLADVRATYSRTATGTGTVTASAHSIGGQRIAVSGVGTTRVLMRPVAGQIGDYSVDIPFGAAAPFKQVTVVNRTDASLPRAAVEARDIVRIQEASFINGVLTVRATTTDLFTGTGRVVLQVQDSTGTRIGRIGPRGFFRIQTAVNPGRIRVVSTGGGRAGRVVATQ